MDGGAWKAAVHGVAEGWTRLSDITFTFHFHALEKEMATHSSVLAWRTPGTGEPDELPPMGSHRTGPETTDWFKIGKGVCQGCILSPCLLFNLYAKYIRQNAGLDEAQAGIKIAGRNINNLRYADDTIFMAESEELKSLLMKVKEESEKIGFTQHSEN